MIKKKKKSISRPPGPPVELPGPRTARVARYFETRSQVKPEPEVVAPKPLRPMPEGYAEALRDKVGLYKHLWSMGLRTPAIVVCADAEGLFYKVLYPRDPGVEFWNGIRVLWAPSVGVVSGGQSW